MHGGDGTFGEWCRLGLGCLVCWICVVTIGAGDDMGLVAWFGIQFVYSSETQQNMAKAVAMSMSLVGGGGGSDMIAYYSLGQYSKVLL